MRQIRFIVLMAATVACSNSSTTQFAKTRCFTGQDIDVDGVCEIDDNCPTTSNRAQSDADGDGLGDACDPCVVERANKCLSKLVFWFGFQEDDWATTTDSIGGLTGDVVGGVKLEVNKGFYGGAAVFDGTAGGKIDLELPSVPGQSTNVLGEVAQYQLEARIKAEPTGAEQVVVFTDPISFAMAITADGFVRCVWAAKDWPEPRNVTGWRNVLDGEWHHIACVRSIDTEGGSVTPKMGVLIDGVVDAARPEAFAGTELATSWWMTIGSDVWGGSTFSGSIDDLKLGEPALELVHDWDWDGAKNVTDNCPLIHNPGQVDGDDDGAGDACGNWEHMSCTEDVHCANHTGCAEANCRYGVCVYTVAAGAACDDGDAYSIDDLCGEDGVCQGHYPPIVFDADTELGPGHHRFGPVTIQPGVTVTCLSDQNSYFGQGCTIYAPTIVIEQGARLSADGQGFEGLRGPGGGCSTGDSCDHQGAGHGGDGGISGVDVGCSRAYGSAGFPIELGSGSAERSDSGACISGAQGGGSIILQLYDGPAVIDGRVTAVGAAGSSAGASGGSILIQSPTVTGTGIIDASGGDGAVAGGSGGRISVHGDMQGFEGIILYGGGGVDTGSPGEDGTMVLQ